MWIGDIIWHLLAGVDPGNEAKRKVLATLRGEKTATKKKAA